MPNIVQLLIDQDMVSRKDLDRILSAQSGSESIHRLLIRSGLISEDDFLELASRELGYDLLDHLPEGFDPEPFAGLSPLFMEEHVFLPVGMHPGEVRVAVNDPFDHLVLDTLEKLYPDRRITLLLARKERIKHWVEERFAADQSGAPVPEEAEDAASLGEMHEDIEQLRDLASEAPVIRKVSEIMTSAVEQEASDIHVEPFEDRVRIRFRIDGVLREHLQLPAHLHQALTTRIKIMARLDIAERRIPQDGRIRLRVAGKSIDLRVSCLPTMFGESVVLRILDQSSISFSLRNLGFPARELDLFEELIRAPHGIVLVTGPTGSGKTTTLYAALNSIYSVERKIITIEDPVEYELDGINQIQVNTKAGLTFASGLRAIVRQDPDVILIGEIRDKETADIAIQSALTGHLVFSTLHTNDAAGAVTRLMEIGVEDYLLASSVICIMAQRLIRLLCDHCKQPLLPDEELLSRYELADRGEVPQTIYTPSGCALCNHTGYRSRTAIFELMVVTEAVRELILRNKSATAIRKLAMEQGMTLLRRDGWNKVRTGETSVEEVLRVTGQ